MKVGFYKVYILPFLLLLAAEVAIAIFEFHEFVRGFIGDVLVIPLLYSFFRVFFKTKTWRIASLTLGIAMLIEVLQIFDIYTKFNLENKFLKIVLGSTFDFWDILAYSIGFLLILIFEKTIRNC